MVDEQIEAHPQRFVVHATADSHFSWMRTRWSLERTLMSWVRTAVSLIGFGFTIVQFFERLSSMEGVHPALRPQAPRSVGLSLIAEGFEVHIPKGYIYFSMAFALFVDVIQLRMDKRKKPPVQTREHYLPHEDEKVKGF